MAYALLGQGIPGHRRPNLSGPRAPCNEHPPLAGIGSSCSAGPPGSGSVPDPPTCPGGKTPPRPISKQLLLLTSPPSPLLAIPHLEATLSVKKTNRRQRLLRRQEEHFHSSCFPRTEAQETGCECTHACMHTRTWGQGQTGRHMRMWGHTSAQLPPW